MKKLLISAAVIIFILIAYFLFKDDSYEKNEVSKRTEEQKTEVIGSLIKKRLNVEIKKARKNKSKEDIEYDEVEFSNKTNLEPLTKEDIISIQGEALQKRLKDLDSKLDDAIQKYPDLPPPPEWYTEEMEYLGNKYFATSGKSKYKTELNEEEGEKRERYLRYLEKVEQEGLEINNEELAEQKRKIYGE